MGLNFLFLIFLEYCLLVICRANNIQREGNGGIIVGEKLRCDKEGEPVYLEHKIKNIKNCFSCICKNGLVDCHDKYQCPPTEGCHLLLGRQKGDCCVRCKGCMYEGRYHESHTEWVEPKRPCTIFRCEAGIITESNIQCYTPCSRPLRPAPGKCCGTCPGCRINGQNVTRDVTIPEDPCVKCHCEDGKMTCLKKSCPVLQCSASQGKLYKPPGECCAQCTGTRSLIPAKNLCLVGTQVYMPNVNFNKDHCTQCTCINETAICRRNTCPVLECDVELQETEPGACCPHCPLIEEYKSTCSVGGKTYQDGETWHLDACKSCMCQKGEIRCAMQRCPPNPGPCPLNSKLVKRPGQCCAQCVEDDGVCTVFGDPHYKTFDGKFYSFQGSCKYQLATDCLGNNSFSVRVTNDPRNTKYSSWTRTVSIKAGNLKVNLGQKLRVKVNGKRIDPPYSVDGRVQIYKQNDSVVVKTYIGIGVLWNGHGYLEISASPRYKGKLCGLCGNYNSIAQDDLIMRNRILLNDTAVWKFANSWKVGGKKACGRQNEHNYKKPQCRPRNNQRPCRGLKAREHFGDCDTKLSPNNYYDACIQDMCECPSGSCYCESFEAYAYECIRLGAELPNWRQETKCQNRRNRKRTQEPPKPKNRSQDISHLIAQFNPVFKPRSKNNETLTRLPIN